jgi:hypothetical protein
MGPQALRRPVVAWNAANFSFWPSSLAKTADEAGLTSGRARRPRDVASIFFDSVSAVVINALRKHKCSNQRRALPSAVPTILIASLLGWLKFVATSWNGTS